MAEQRSVRNVVQMTCGSDIASEAKRLFGVIDNNGNLPIVLVPETRGGIPMFITVPTGCACIVQKDGVNLGELQPGRQFADYHNRVVYVVTKQACTFNTSVKACATRDNVMCTVDLTLVFTIEQPVTFVYKIGATHFNDMLKAVSEEATRGLVRSIDHTSIYELRSSAADSMISVLNRVFREFGVSFINATVTNVALPPDLSECLEKASKIDSELAEEVRSQEYRLKQLNDKADLELKELTLQNERAIADLVAKKERMAIETEAKIAEAKKTAELAILQAQQATDTQKVKARAALRDDQVKAQLEVEKALQKARLDAKARQREIDQWATQEIMRSEAELQKAINDAKIAKLEADAEAAAAQELQSQRAHELKVATLEALEALARSGKIVLAGDAGEQIVQAVSKGLTSF